MSNYIDEMKKGGRQASRIMEAIEGAIDLMREDPGKFKRKTCGNFGNGGIFYRNGRGWIARTSGPIDTINGTEFIIEHYGTVLFRIGPDDGGAIYYITPEEAPSSWSDKCTYNRIMEAIHYLAGSDSDSAIIA